MKHMKNNVMFRFGSHPQDISDICLYGIIQNAFGPEDRGYPTCCMHGSYGLQWNLQPNPIPHPTIACRCTKTGSAVCYGNGDGADQEASERQEKALQLPMGAQS